MYYIHTTMEFPTDVWREIMSFIPSAYREPLHYNAIMEVNTFYFLRRHLCDVARERSVIRRRNVMTYYMHLVQLQRVNSTVPRKPLIKRGVATGLVRDDFVEIFRKYQALAYNNRTSQITYDIPTT